MQVLSKEEETKRCQDTVTRLILALSALAAHDRSGRSALEAELEEAKTKLLSLGRMVTTVTGSGFGFYDISGPDVLQHVLDPRTRVESVLGGESKALKALGQPVCLRDIIHHAHGCVPRDGAQDCHWSKVLVTLRKEGRGLGLRHSRRRWRLVLRCRWPLRPSHASKHAM